MKMTALARAVKASMTGAAFGADGQLPEANHRPTPQAPAQRLRQKYTRR
jgi:hypothetical protein